LRLPTTKASYFAALPETQRPIAALDEADEEKIVGGLRDFVVHHPAVKSWEGLRVGLHFNPGKGDAEFALESMKRRRRNYMTACK
jgi:hypothetical protein